MVNEGLCNCGRKLRYSHGPVEANVMSCNKYTVCPSYDELEKLLKNATEESSKYKHVLDMIVRVEGKDYEYKAWAKQALDN